MFLAIDLKKAVIHVMSRLITRKRIVIHTMKMINICKTGLEKNAYFREESTK